MYPGTGSSASRAVMSSGSAQNSQAGRALPSALSVGLPSIYGNLNGPPGGQAGYAPPPGYGGGSYLPQGQLGTPMGTRESFSGPDRSPFDADPQSWEMNQQQLQQRMAHGIPHDQREAAFIAYPFLKGRYDLRRRVCVMDEIKACKLPELQKRAAAYKISGSSRLHKPEAQELVMQAALEQFDRGDWPKQPYDKDPLNQVSL